MAEFNLTHLITIYAINKPEQLATAITDFIGQLPEPYKTAATDQLKSAIHNFYDSQKTTVSGTLVELEELISQVENL